MVNEFREEHSLKPMIGLDILDDFAQEFVEQGNLSTDGFGLKKDFENKIFPQIPEIYLHKGSKLKTRIAWMTPTGENPWQ